MGRSNDRKPLSPELLVGALNDPVHKDLGVCRVAKTNRTKSDISNKSITFNQSFDCTQREIVVDIANIIYQSHGCSAKRYPLMYFFESQHPTEKAVLAMAEEIFEMFYGDEPDYFDD